MNNTDLVLQIMPNIGMSMIVSQYISQLISLGFTSRQAVGSLGGSVHGHSIIINRGIVIRI